MIDVLVVVFTYFIMGLFTYIIWGKVIDKYGLETIPFGESIIFWPVIMIELFIKNVFSFTYTMFTKTKFIIFLSNYRLSFSIITLTLFTFVVFYYSYYVYINIF